MAYLETDTQTNIDISSATNIAAYTATYNGQKIGCNLYAVQLAGNGDYIVYMTRTPSGGSEALIGPKTTITLASGETTLSADSNDIKCQSGTILKVYIDGLAGDTTTPDTTVNWYDDTPVQSTTLDGRTLDISVTGEAGIDWANVGTPGSTVGLSATTIGTATAVTTVNGLAAGTITAAAVATGAIDADALSVDAGTEIGTAVWASATRTLTQSAPSVTAAVNGGSFDITIGDTLAQAFTGLVDATGYTSIIFCVKQNEGDADADSIFLIRKNASESGDGLQVLNGAATGFDATDGSLTITSGTARTVNLIADDTVQLPFAPGMYYGWKVLVGTTWTTYNPGVVNLVHGISKAVA